MKHILILLISILLLSSFITSCVKNGSSPVIGDNHKGETLYRWGEFPDYVWKGVGEKDTYPEYKGEVENGVPNGQGTLTTPNGWKYVGEWKGGEMWNGTIYDKDGNIIKKVVNGKMINQ